MKKTIKQDQNGKPRSKKKGARSHRTYTALEKCQAVLAVWTERRKIADVCRELSVTWSHFNQWQDKALEGMVTALETRRRTKEEKPPPLTERLEKLLAKRGKKTEKLSSHLEKRLADLPEAPSVEET